MILVKLSLKKNGKIVLFCVIILTVLGIYEVYSASNVWALYKENDTLYYFKRQLGFGIIGFIVSMVFSIIYGAILGSMIGSLMYY